MPRERLDRLTPEQRARLLREEREEARPRSRELELAAALGNRAFGELVQRATLARDDGAATATPAVEPRFVHTSFGDFSVYPDDAPLSLGAAQYRDNAPGQSGPIAPMPVTESVFAQIEVAIQSVEGGAAGLVVTGGVAFKAGVLADLAWLMTQPVGMEMIEAMVATGKTLTISETGSGNTTGYDPDADSWPKADGTPGNGSNCRIAYNPGQWNPYGGAEAWMTRPPAIGLAHEMVHAWTGMTGTRAAGLTGGVKNRELQATGLGAYANAIYTENRFRVAFGLPERPRY